jgi:hypothetical protein
MHKFQKSLIGVSVFAITLLSPNLAHAQSCETYLGQTPKLTDIKTAIEQNQSIEPKGEFESTAEYQARLVRVTRVTKRLIIPKKINATKLSYQADEESFRVGVGTFDDQYAVFSKALWEVGGPFYDPNAPFGVKRYVDTRIKMEDIPSGKYNAANAFGREVEVIELDSISWGIFDRKLEGLSFRSSRQELIVPPVKKSDYIGEFAIPRTEAAAFKSTATAAFVVEPREPWSISHREAFPSKSTIRRPLKETKVFNVLFADLKCALILDADKKVVAAFDTL